MGGSYEMLLQPGRIGKLDIRNRIAMAPMGTALAEPDGRYSARQRDYYAERAKGGVGLIIVEATKAEAAIDKPAAFPLSKADSNSLIPAMADLVQAVHDYGAKIAMQITPGMGRQGDASDPNNPPVAPSPVPAFENPAVTCRALTVEEIHKIVEACGLAALRAAMAGFDMIEIHGHTGYLIDQFVSTQWNHRTDEYGGSLENRLRFPLEIIQAMREQVGPDMPIGFRFSVRHGCPGGRELEESLEMVRHFAAAGVDALHIDAGCYDAMDYVFPPLYLPDALFVDLAAAVKAIVDIPVIAVGNMDPDTAEATLEAGKADFVAFGRGLIADPSFPKALAEGRREDVRPCIKCDEKCVGNLFSLKAVSCSVNPAAGNERYYEIHKAEQPKKVVVVGGGPAGLEAARVAAIRGHKVTVLEKEGALGGQLRAAATSPFKKDLRRLIDWWAVQLGKLGVEVRLNTEATPEVLSFLGPDAVVLATGALPLKPPIPGIDGDNVVEVLDYHLGRRHLDGKRIVVAGGGLAGCDAALELAMEGKEVTIVEMLGDIARDLNAVSRISLLRLLAENKVKVLTGHRIVEFRSNGLLAQKADGQQVLVEGDAVLLALGTQANASLQGKLGGLPAEIYMAGDCTKPAKVGEAIQAGFAVGWQI